MLKTIFDHWFLSLIFTAIPLIGVKMITDALKLKYHPPQPIAPTPPAPRLPEVKAPPVPPVLTPEQGKAALALVRGKGVELLDSKNLMLIQYVGWRVAAVETIKKSFGAPSQLGQMFNLREYSEADYELPFDYTPEVEDFQRDSTAYFKHEIERGVRILEGLIEHLDLQAKVDMINLQPESGKEGEHERTS